ncbi:TPA: helix-turn-helix transcriptional regulator [Enterococcus faecalis]|uniref:helix-turn-helix transcriptional regulator n=1 Tax=Enterococcus faecalis TaxID=1351 RepID=UPI0019F13D0A|nr:XRE family transcriptional regulator [Enterococcus faecalis]EKJ3581671.1 helix-turn-helix transcriptional regulator [Enterococcus faecalis]EKQ3613721.1 helix-turn-helix transcriptional regulator [Enterococcus faecalis]HCT9166075.1 helix-turn-helix transcriptional regulator [Enterococcus faecalis]
MNITENILFYRLQNGFSQNSLAEHLNISRQAISKWEQGICLPDIENIILLSQLYNITLDEFFFAENSLNNLNVSSFTQVINS